MKKSRPPPPSRTRQQAPRVSTSAVDVQFQEALRLHKAGDLAAAEPLYRRVLQAMPTHADALQLLGTIEGQRGNNAASLDLLQKAVALNPANGHAQGNLGKALSEAKRLPEALECFQRACELLPGNVKALVNLGRTYFKLNDAEEALAFYDRALALEPQSVATAQHRCEVLILLAQTDAAYRDRAVASLHLLRHHKHDETAIRFALAALGAGELPAAMPADTVTKLFDGYADRFDHHLTHILGYRGPECVAEALQRVTLPAPGRVLDLGCGTGLCGPLLRPLALQLVGVDLSPRMLEKATERGLYDELVCAELLDYLRAVGPAPGPGLTLVVAADVFIYIGDLSPVFAAVSAAMVEGGLFVFSVESADGAGDGDGDGGSFVLNPTRRFAHSRAHIDGLIQAHGFDLVLGESAVLRQESGAGVPGALFVLRRRAELKPCG